MSKVDTYVATLNELPDWIPYLREASGLPGPRGNLELAHAVARAGNQIRFEELLTFAQLATDANSPDEYLRFCGILGLGRLVADGDDRWLALLRASASDARWRIREGVATALQLVGDADMVRLLAYMDNWRQGSWLEQRAVVAALAEPRLLRQPDQVACVRAIFDAITIATLAAAHRNEDFKVLRQALGYAWSVIVAAQPEAGKPVLEHWFVQAQATGDRDLRWIMRENLKKKRLAAVDPAWVELWAGRL